MDYYISTAIAFPLSICPPTLEALVAMCNGEGALLHGQLVKFGELLKQWRKGRGKQTEIMSEEKSGRLFKAEILKIYFPLVSGYSDNERKT